jgi:glycosyltransferase involved in cell wall biosynthesis
MRLGIVSDCIHFIHPDGRTGTEVHILLQQFESLAIYFDSVVICCPFVDYDEKKVATYYADKKISFIPVPNAGGDGIKDKLKLIKTIPAWRKAFKQLDKKCGIVYQRFPNNLNIPGFFYFHSKHKKVFATYTGTWSDYSGEPKTYRFQKWLLKKYFRGPVWAYLKNELNDKKIKKGFSPSYKQSVWFEEEEQVNNRIEKLQQHALQKLKLITVGAFVPNKNQQLILQACLLLKKANIPFQLTLVGDGFLKESYQKFINDNQLNNEIVIAGKKTSTELRELYRQHDFIVQSPITEGFGKVPIEGFFHGLIPVLRNVTLAKSMTGNNERGYVFEGNEAENLLNVLKEIWLNQSHLADYIIAGRKYAFTQTLEAWAKEYFETINEYFSFDKNNNI